MRESLKIKLMEQYPPYHDQPLRLSITEIDNPNAVLSFFFTCYDLPDIRVCLKELLHDALRADNSEASSHVALHQDLEKLVEASWLIHQQSNFVQESKDVLPEIPQKVNQEASATEESDSKYPPIDDFFESFTLPFARYYLMTAIKAAESPTIWNKRAPTDLLHFFEMLEALASSVYTIVKTDNKTKKVVLPRTPGSPDLTQYTLYCGAYDQIEPWDYFPRYLSTKEFRDPFKALQKFTEWNSKKEWQQTLRYFLSYALGENSLSELGVDLQLIKTTELLQKMLEACHLIYVRTRLKNSLTEPEN